jgi:hypothetical protein
VAGGKVTAVRPSPELAPLFALKASEYTSAVPTGVGTGHVYIVDGIVVDGVAEYVGLARDVGLTAS